MGSLGNLKKFFFNIRKIYVTEEKAMKKIILQMNMTLDGMITGENGEMDWMLWNKKLDEFADDIIDSSDLILLGRKTAQEFLDYWPDDKSEFARKINECPKIVFSRTIKNIKSKSTNVSVINENILEEMTKIKNQSGKNIVLYGGAEIVQSFAKLDLIDEYRLVLNPVVLGGGKPLFKYEKFKLKLLKTEEVGDGCVILYYAPDRK